MLDELEFGVGVRTHFAVQVDLFVLRGNPFHERRSLRGINDKREDSTSAEIEEGEKPLAAPEIMRGASSQRDSIRRGPEARIPADIIARSSRTRTLGIDFFPPRKHNLSR